jgi:hypothetical protein
LVLRIFRDVLSPIMREIVQIYAEDYDSGKSVSRQPGNRKLPAHVSDFLADLLLDTLIL